ncbi:hypothetical protein NC653_023738 [Populus alba x Populus x berolinensis]|uniref:Uncharacterized protein n=1 Tax=Populus alba x Populus x berolinensis TaxID=444605 RepID=A0AAD6MIM3_9ROSI|nr:hypothetical protein NC653_023738 [Populus alba x Populus x berolinensis]
MILANLSSMLEREYKICLLYIASRVLYIPHLASGALKIRYIFTFGCTINVFSVKTALIIVRKYIIIHVVTKVKSTSSHLVAPLMSSP